MTNKELQEKIDLLEAELAEVKEMAVAMEKKADGGVFEPEDRERYWYISGAGETDSSRWDNYHVDHDRYAIGNCYSTRQSAEDTVRVLKLIQKAKESQDGFVPDWENGEQDKYFLHFYMGDFGVADYISTNVAPIFGYWKDESVCKQFIDENREEILWFFTEYRR